MLTIGLLGGIASGKSTVARLLAEQGAVVLDADQAAHQALADPEVLAAIRERWGEGCFDASGALVRRQVAERIFGPGPEKATEREFLEGLVHPRVRKTLQAELARLESSGARVVVLDIPLLLEAGWAESCDVLLMVNSPQSDRLARAAERGWGAAELAWREAAQTPISEKQRRATATVDNGGSLADLRQQIATLWAAEIAPHGE